MLDSERTFKIKVRSHWTVFEIFLTSAVIIYIERVLHGKEIVQYLQNYKLTKLTKAILKSSYRVLQESICLISCIIVEEKDLSGYILLTDKISLFGWLYFVRYWAICVL